MAGIDGGLAAAGEHQHGARGPVHRKGVVGRGVSESGSGSCCEASCCPFVFISAPRFFAANTAPHPTSAMGGGASKGEKKPAQGSDKLKEASEAALAGKLSVAQKIFKEIDTNKDGKLSKDEILAAVKKFGKDAKSVWTATHITETIALMVVWPFSSCLSTWASRFSRCAI